MYFANKLALANHIIYLIVVSAVMALLLTFVIDSLYTPDPIQCELIKYEVNDDCKTGEGLEIEIQNKGDVSFSVIFNKNLNTAQRLAPGKTRTIQFKTPNPNVQTNLAVISNGGEQICKSHTLKYDLDVLKRC